MRNYIVACLYITIIVTIQFVYSQSSSSQDTTADLSKDQKPALESFIKSIDYGVPSSPALELLPNKPNEVIHILTSHDFQSNLSSILDGTKLRPGFAIDWRPLVRFAGSLASYNKSSLNRLAWRSLLSIGSAQDPTNSANLLLSMGARIPLIDKADPRTSKDLLTKIRRAYRDAEKIVPLPKNMLNDDDVKRYQEQKNALAQTKIDTLLNNFKSNSWNALKVDIGFAEILRAKGNSLSCDSVSHSRLGFWGAAGLPLTKQGQLTISTKMSWIRTDSSKQESARHIVGTRGSFFWTNGIATSVEVARVWSRYKDLPSSNDAWSHFAIFAEFKISIFDSWVGLAYGGDMGRRDNSDKKLSLYYSVYKNRLISQ